MAQQGEKPGPGRREQKEAMRAMLYAQSTERIGIGQRASAADRRQRERYVPAAVNPRNYQRPQYYGLSTTRSTRGRDLVDKAHPLRRRTLTGAALKAGAQAGLSPHSDSGT